jgi:hypothetical protein
MGFKIDFDPQARNDLKSMRGFERAATLETVERLLTQSPTMTSAVESNGSAASIRRNIGFG